MSQPPNLTYNTLSQGDITTALHNARQTLTGQTERLRPYLPELIQRLATVYGIPFAIVLLTSTLGGRLLSTFIPLSTTNILIFGLNIFILVQVWRWAEKRWQATGLFVQYSRFSRAKRDLRDRIEEAEKGTLLQADRLDSQATTVRLWADTFLRNATEAGITPYQKS